MSKNTTTGQSVDLALRVLRSPAPWQAFVLPVSGFPIPEQECGPLAKFMERISTSAAKRWKLSSEVFMELEQMKGLECRHAFADHGKEWLPEVGLGVWPDREPPRLWTRKEFENLQPGGKLREILCEVFRISTSPQHRAAARAAMLKFGPVTEILTPETTEGLLEKMKPVYLAFIKERSHRCFPYFIPLLEGKSIESMTPEQLQNWCPGISVYIRESFQDGGILLASTMPLVEVLEELGGVLDTREAAPKWRVPI
jgi:hypothetical protein